MLHSIALRLYMRCYVDIDAAAAIDSQYCARRYCHIAIVECVNYKHIMT